MRAWLHAHRFAADALERIGWTALQAAGGAALDLLESGEVSFRAVAYAAALAAVKAAIGRGIGRRDTASTLPRDLEPPAVPPPGA